MAAIPDSELVTIGEAADVLRLHVDTLRAAVREGIVPSVQILGRRQIHRSVLEEILRNGTDAVRPNAASQESFANA